MLTHIHQPDPFQYVPASFLTRAWDLPIMSQEAFERIKAIVQGIDIVKVKA